ncbi:MAG: hypothetical protein AAB428_03635 [Patescibacteria group bacterium]
MKITRSNSVIRKSPYMARKKYQTEFAKKATLFFLVLAVFLGLALYGLYRPEVRVRNISVSGTFVIKPDDIKKMAEGELSGEYFYLLPRRSIFIYPKEELENKLAENFKRIQGINIERTGFTEILINIRERSERYLWCGRDLIEERAPSDGCYFVDSGGYLFSKAPYYSGNLFLEFYGPLADGENNKPVGGTVLPEENFENLIRFGEDLALIHLLPQKILLKADGDYEIFLERGGRVMINSKNNLQKNIEYLKLALATNPLKTKMETARETLDYLDIRFGNKVFYKFR